MILDSIFLETRENLARNFKYKMYFFNYNTVKKGKGVHQNHLDYNQEQLVQLANSTLGSANLKMAVILPEGCDTNEWIALNTFEFVNQIKLLFGFVSDSCNQKSCPIMNAGPNYEYLWCDDDEYKRPTRLSASQYMALLLDKCQKQMDDETIFPTSSGISFGKKFIPCVKVIFKKLARVYAHLYYSHFQLFIDSGVDTLINTSFKHFIYFSNEFRLISDKDLQPLSPILINSSLPL